MENASSQSVGGPLWAAGNRTDFSTDIPSLKSSRLQRGGPGSGFIRPALREKCSIWAAVVIRRVCVVFIIGWPGPERPQSMARSSESNVLFTRERQQQQVSTRAPVHAGSAQVRFNGCLSGCFLDSFSRSPH